MVAILQVWVAKWGTDLAGQFPLRPVISAKYYRAATRLKYSHQTPIVKKKCCIAAKIVFIGSNKLSY
jgi:hypothetical protein